MTSGGDGSTAAGGRAHHRPTRPGGAFFDAVEGGEDPALLREAADRAAALLVRGARRSGADGDDGVVDRVLHLADTEGLETLAELWSGAPADSLAGSLWRLYALRSWVHADPRGAARQYDAGRHRAQVARVVSGVADPPGPDELRAMVDELLRGLATRELADVLLRAAAFARVVATGRAALADAGEVGGAAGPAGGPGEGPLGAGAARMGVLADQLEHAARLELGTGLA